MKMIDRDDKKLSIARQAELLGINRTSLYYINNFRKSYKIRGSAPDPVLAGRQPVCKNSPGNKRMYIYWMSRVKMNSLTLALDIL
jgi:hypothetical protein